MSSVLVTSSSGRHCKLDNGVESIGGDTTVVVSVSGHPDVSLLSPSGSPAVLYDPVVRSSGRSVSYYKNGVVQTVGRASGLIVYTRSVALERVVTSIDGNGHGSDGSGGLFQSGLATLGNVVVALQLGNVCLACILASLVSCVVGVVRLEHSTLVFHPPFEGEVNSSTVTSVASIVTVHQLLLAQAQQFTCKINMC